MWSIEFLKEAESDLVKLDKSIRRRVIEKIEWLQENFDDVSLLPLHGEFSDFLKLRVGDWRVFYSVDWKKNVITICYIGNRSKVYKKRR